MQFEEKFGTRTISETISYTRILLPTVVKPNVNSFVKSYPLMCLLNALQS